MTQSLMKQKLKLKPVEDELLLNIHTFIRWIKSRPLSYVGLTNAREVGLLNRIQLYNNKCSYTEFSSKQRGKVKGKHMGSY